MCAYEEGKAGETEGEREERGREEGEAETVTGEHIKYISGQVPAERLKRELTVPNAGKERESNRKPPFPNSGETVNWQNHFEKLSGNMY